MTNELSKVVEEITMKMFETESEFIYETITPYCENLMQKRISKEELNRALIFGIGKKRYKPITLKETDAEPRTLKAILDTETSEVYIRQATLEYWEDVRGCEVVEDDE